MRQFFQSLPRRILWFCAGFGLSSMGIPFGGLFARLLDGIAFGASTTAEVIRHFESPEAATRAIGIHGNKGAVAKTVWQDKETGQHAVKFDTSGYTGHDITIDTIEALQADWI